MSYEQPFNGDYDHQDLFGIGEQVWYSWWDVNTVKYEARLVEIKKIIIDSDGVGYAVEYADHDRVDEHVDNLGDLVLYENGDDAREYARERLVLELQNKVHYAETQLESSKKCYDNAMLEYCQLNEKLKKLE